MPNATTPLTPTPLPPEDESATLAALQVSVSRHRVWLIVLSAVLVLSFLGIIGMGVLVVGPFMGGFAVSSGASEEQIDEAESEIQQAYGSRLEDLEVRVVEVKYGGAPFPYSLMDGDTMKSLYISYGLQGSDVIIADLLDVDMFGGDLSMTGMLPTKGSMVSRMTPEQFDKLLVAYSAETEKPLGSVRRYGDEPFFMETGQTAPEEVTVNNETFPTKELWTAAEGRIIEGDSVDMNDGAYMGGVALIFHEDPETGEFTFLGTEPVETMW